MKKASTACGNDYPVCQTCRHSRICNLIHQNLQTLDATVPLLEKNVVELHSLKLMLDEKDFGFPDGRRPCEFADKSLDSLMAILNQQTQLLWKKIS